MKLNKLLFPLFASIASANIIVPMSTSCGNNESKDGGKITISKIGQIVDAKFSASKTSYTDEEAKKRIHNWV